MKEEYESWDVRGKATIRALLCVLGLLVITLIGTIATTLVITIARGF